MLGLALVATPVRAELVGLWRFDQNVSPQPDASGNGHSGSLEGDVLWANDSVRGGTMEFDGDADYLEVADTDLLSIEGDLTIAAWVQLSDFTSWNSIVSKTGASRLNYPGPFDLYTTNNGGGIPRLYLGDGNDVIGFADGLEAPALEEWQHLAVTVSEDGEVIHYLNGQESGIGSVAAPRIDNDSSLIIGSRADFVTNMLGRMDDVALFNEVLGPEQIVKITSGDFSDYLGGGLLGDFDGNGALEVNDLDLLTAESIAGTNTAAYDLNSDGAVNNGDRSVWVEDLKTTWFGDSNLDGEFNSSDFVQVFQRGQYEDGIAKNSKWGDGDWSGDADFDSSDFVQAFQGGGFEIGPRPAAAVAAVPEPSSLLLLLVGLLGCRRCRRSF